MWHLSDSKSALDLYPVYSLIRSSHLHCYCCDNFHYISLFSDSCCNLCHDLSIKFSCSNVWYIVLNSYPSIPRGGLLFSHFTILPSSFCLFLVVEPYSSVDRSIQVMNCLLARLSTCLSCTTRRNFAQQRLSSLLLSDYV